MKILFVSPAMEEKSRGIGAIFRSLVESAKQDGHEVYVAMGHPHNAITEETHDERYAAEHRDALTYLDEGRDSFDAMIGAKFGRKRMLIDLLRGHIFKQRITKIDQSLVGESQTFLKHADFMVKSPYFYLLLNFRKLFICCLTQSEHADTKERILFEYIESSLNGLFATFG